MTRLRAVVALILGLPSLQGCQADKEAPAPAKERASPASKLPAAEPPLDREALLLAVSRAASAVSLEADDEAAQRLLDGKRFELRIRFGCGAGAEAPAPLMRGWSFDEARRVLRVRIEPDLTGDAVVDALAGGEFEEVEGFWVPRPWLLAPGCPRIATGQAADPDRPDAPKVRLAAPPPSRSTVGIAQFYTDLDSRTRRRNNRAFEVTKSLDPEQRPSAGGYNLVLAGRLKALPSGRVIACAHGDPDQAPRCVISAQFDHTAIEQPGDGETLAQWNAG